MLRLRYKQSNKSSMKFFIFIFLIGSNVLLYGQTISGIIMEKNSNNPVEYVNIGIVGKNIGTVSDQNGKYTLQIASEYHNDTLRFSCIGHHPYSVKISDFINLNNGNVNLEKRVYELTEVVVRPRRISEKRLGITTKSKLAVGCFADSINGREIGIIIKNKKTVFLKEVNLNIVTCTYDSIFYRINIYKAHNDMQFEDILTKPIYVSSSKEEVKDKITIDLRHLYLKIDSDFLVTFEAVKNLGAGSLCFPASLLYKTYIRKTSHGTWETRPAGISISALVDVEK